jgi:hypothetical protein
LELVFCSAECKRRALLEKNDDDFRTGGRSADLPAGIVFRAYDGGLVVARVRSQSPGAFHIVHDDTERSVSRVEVLYELAMDENVQEAREFLTVYRRAIAQAEKDLSRSLARLAKTK